MQHAPVSEVRTEAGLLAGSGHCAPGEPRAHARHSRLQRVTPPGVVLRGWRSDRERDVEREPLRQITVDSAAPRDGFRSPVGRDGPRTGSTTCPLPHLQYLVRGNVLEQMDCPARPLDLNQRRLLRRAQAKMQAPVPGREVAARGRHSQVLLATAVNPDSDAGEPMASRLLSEPVRSRASQLLSLPPLRSRERPLVPAVHCDVQEAVVV